MSKDREPKNPVEQRVYSKRYLLIIIFALILFSGGAIYLVPELFASDSQLVHQLTRVNNVNQLTLQDHERGIILPLLPDQPEIIERIFQVNTNPMYIFRMLPTTISQAGRKAIVNMNEKSRRMEIQVVDYRTGELTSLGSGTQFISTPSENLIAAYIFDDELMRNTLQIFRFDGRQWHQILQGGGSVRMADFSADEVWFGFEENHIYRLVNLETGETLQPDIDLRSLNQIQPLTDGGVVFVQRDDASGRTQLVIRNVDQTEETQQVIEQNVQYSRMIDNDRYLLYIANDHDLRIFDILTNKRVIIESIGSVQVLESGFYYGNLNNLEHLPFADLPALMSERGISDEEYQDTISR